MYAAVPGLPDDPDVQQAILAAAKLDAPAKQAGVSAPWKAKDAKAWDRMTLDDWMRTEIPSEKGRAIFVSACQAIWGADPSELSLLYALQYTAAAGNAKTPGSFLRLITTAGGAQERRFVGRLPARQPEAGRPPGQARRAARAGAGGRPGRRRRAHRGRRRPRCRRAR